MSIAKRNSFFSTSFFIFITRFFPSLASLLVLIWYSRHLPQDVYGNYQHFWIQLSVIYPLICLGIHVFAVAYPRHFVVQLVRSLSPKHFVAYGAWTLLLSIAFALLQSSGLHVSFLTSFLFIIVYSFTLIAESFLIISRHFKSLITANILYSAAYCGIHWYVLNNDFSLDKVFFYLLVATAARFIFYCIAASATKEEVPEATKTDYDPARLRNLWLHLGAYDVLQVLFSWIDKFVISLVLTAGLSAVYFNGSQNIPFLPLLISAAGSAVLMQLAHGNRDNEDAQTIQLMNQTGRVLSGIVFPVFFFLLLFRQELIITLFTAKYAASIPVFAVSILVLPVRAYSFTTVLQRRHKGAIINAGAIGDLVLACALMYPLYTWMGLPGIALSFVISTYLQASFYLIYSAKLLGTSVLNMIPYANWAIKLIVYATMFIAIHYYCRQHFTDQITLILGGLAMTAAVVVSLAIEYSKQRRHGGQQ